MSKEWQEGYEAQQRGVNRAENPYIFDNLQREDWSKGWWASYSDTAEVARAGRD